MSQSGQIPTKFKSAITFPFISLKHHGGVKSLIFFMNHLAENGYLVQVLVPKDMIKPSVLLHEKIDVYHLPPLESYNAVNLLKLLLQMYRQMPPSDLIVANFFLTFYPSYFYAMKQNIPLAYYIQDLEDRFYSFPMNFLARWTYKKKTVNFSFVSSFVMENIGKEGPVIQPGIKGFWYEPDEDLMRSKGNRLAVLYIVRREKRKGADLFFDSLKRLQKRDDFVLWLIGEGKWNVPSWIDVQVFPFQDIKGLRRLYSSADIFVHTSYFEGFGLPPLEAMACRTAVIVTDSGGVNEYVKNGINAIVVLKDPGSIAGAIQKLLDSEDLRASLSSEGVKTASLFEIKKRVHKFRNWIEEILKGAK